MVHKLKSARINIFLKRCEYGRDNLITYLKQFWFCMKAELAHIVVHNFIKYSASGPGSWHIAKDVFRRHFVSLSLFLLIIWPFNRSWLVRLLVCVLLYLKYMTLLLFYNSEAREKLHYKKQLCKDHQEILVIPYLGYNHKPHSSFSNHLLLIVVNYPCLSYAFIS